MQRLRCGANRASLLRYRLFSRSLLLGGSSPRENVDCVIVVLAAVVLKKRPRAGIQRGNCRPRPRPGGGIVDGELVFDRLRINALEGFRDLLGFVVTVAIGVIGPKVRGFDDQRVAFPMSAGVSMPLVDIRRDVR